jgi:hypothetical protein
MFTYHKSYLFTFGEDYFCECLICVSLRYCRKQPFIAAFNQKYRSYALRPLKTCSYSLPFSCFFSINHILGLLVDTISFLKNRHKTTGLRKVHVAKCLDFHVWHVRTNNNPRNKKQNSKTNKRLGIINAKYQKTLTLGIWAPYGCRKSKKKFIICEKN